MSDEIDSEESTDIEPQFLLSHQAFKFDKIPKEKFNLLRAVRDRELGFHRVGIREQIRLLTPANSFGFRRQLFNSLKLIQILETKCSLEEHSANVQSVDFSSSGERLCSGGNDLKVAIWDWKEENLSHIYYSGHMLKIRQCKWTLDERGVVTCSDDNHVRLGSVYSAGVSQSNVIATHRGPVNCISLCDANGVLSAGDDGTVRFVDLREQTPKVLVSLSKKQRALPLYSIDCNMHLKPHQFVACGEGAFIRLYDRRFISSHRDCFSLKPDDCPTIDNLSVTCVQMCPFNERHVLASYNNSDLYVMDIAAGKAVRKLIGHCCRPILNKCAWFGERFVFSTSSDGFVYAWDIDSMYPIFCAQADEVGNVNSICVHPADPFVATCGSNCDIKLWQPCRRSDDAFDYARLKQRVVENVNERRVYDYYCQYLDENQERDVYACMVRLLDDTLFQQQQSGSSSSSDHEDYETFEEPECIQS